MAKFRVAALAGALTKVKDYARENPEKTSDAIGRVEGFVRSKAGPQHAAKVGKGGDALRKGLGVPSDPTGRRVQGSGPDSPGPAGGPGSAPGEDAPGSGGAR